MARGRRKKEDVQQSLIIRKPEKVDEDMVGMSKDFAAKHLRQVDFVGWTPVQQQLFFLVLGGIDWRDGDNKNVITIDNHKASMAMGWNYADLRNIGAEMRKEFDYMTSHSVLRIQNPRTGKWHVSNLITDAYGDSISTHVVLNSRFMPHFEQLYETAALTGRPFLTMIGHDVTDFRSSFAYPLFMNLRLQWPQQVDYHIVKYTTKQLKEMFNMDVEDYMRKDLSTGEFVSFNRAGFENKAVIPAIEDINRGETMKIYTWSNGKPFEKEKLNGKVHYYVFKYKVFERDEIISNRKKIYDCYRKEVEMPIDDWLESDSKEIVDGKKLESVDV